MHHSTTTKPSMDRREFMANSTLAAGAAAGLLATAAATPSAVAAPKHSFMKSLKMGMITREDADGNPLSIEDRLAIAKNAGFASVEPATIFDDKTLGEYSKAIEKLDFSVDAVVCANQWGNPLSDADPAVYEKTMMAMRKSIENVKALGGDMVLLVPAVVNPGTRYEDAWTRSVERIKILAEDAERAGVTIGIENVWNKFLLSPLEARAFVDEIDSKYVQSWLDVGNMIQFGYPQDWIRTLGHRIARVDIKDFRRNGNAFVELGKGDVDWPEVMKAFGEIGYQGYGAAEVKGGDLAYLTKAVSKPMDTFFAM
ncbi:MAG: sugar phosphate isomerase/epimerase [Candidatus Hydrogenedentes bacterium]|nr:sugar phosphate isomerase/epimerase [Candidatus Hydrogenedentota bacterium]